MPLHLESIVPENRSDKTMALFLETVNATKVLCASKDGLIIHTQKVLIDSIRDEPFGKLVFTMRIDQEAKAVKVIDLDLVLENNRPTKLELIERLRKSSDANEYYEAEVAKKGGRLQIETVNRNAFEGELENTTHDFRLSAFPFRVNVFNDMAEANERHGFKTKVKVEGRDMLIDGYSDTFLAPASVFQSGSDNDETYTFFYGRVNGIRNIECRDFEDPLNFLIVDVVSGMGVIPVAMSPECFDLSNLAIGKIVELRADIKADMAADAPERK